MNPKHPFDPPISEAELHACVDGQLTPERQREVEAYLANRPEEAQRVASYRAQTARAACAVRPGAATRRCRLRCGGRRGRATPGGCSGSRPASLIALLGGAAGWGLRGVSPARLAAQPPSELALAAHGFAQRAAIAHAVYSPDARRPVEVDAAHEDQLVAWLSKRMGTPMHPPHLQSLGYALEGGRLLPGGRGPGGAVHVPRGRQRREGRLTVYVSNEIGEVAATRRPPHRVPLRRGRPGQRLLLGRRPVRLCDRRRRRPGGAGPRRRRGLSAACRWREVIRAICDGPSAMALALGCRRQSSADATADATNRLGFSPATTTA